MFDQPAEDELAHARQTAAAAGLDAARLTATARFLAGPGDGLGPVNELTPVLMSRDSTDPRWERIEPFEQRWALLVLQIAAIAAPFEAVSDCRRRGCSWAAIGSALGVAPQTAHERFAGRIR